MSRRHRDRCTADHADHPAVYLDGAALARRASFVRAVLRELGVPSQDEDDVCQEVIAGAWRSMMDGRFRPLPSVPLARSIERWLFGITWRQVGHYRGVAWRRREVLSTDGDAAGAESIEGCLDARDLLRELDRLRADYREALLMRVAGYVYSEIAARQVISRGTATNRVRLARKHFRALAKRRGR